ncbi:DEAD/DEAH box helicase [Verminephrobacter eiseniae]|uniref:DEAD/DEAH box helicase n=1 Tax=Verminephrobacter eiseniae TaxID=364317 RepID=UPI002238E7B3|nr:DEAD/DEAH box helicase [Verminephrobacter eiseniae]MCW5235249.1 DEAD/DEAH box helicase [Verminephrobacter eiseniae]
MAFKKLPAAPSTSKTPDQLFLDLPRRRYTGLLDHQGQMLRTYAEKAVASQDVALQLPTGSGKTLVGLLIAEWRRRTFQERVVYLCPTRQLVNQVVEEATTKYGMEVDGFTGSAKEYEACARGRYTSGQRVAVTTYSSLFNTNPFFKTPDVILLDDAHAAENYVAKMWTLQVDRNSAKHPGLFASLAGVLQSVMEPYFHARLTSSTSGVNDIGWVDKLSTVALAQIADEVRAILNVHTADKEIVFSWKSIGENLLGCHFYMSSHQLLIRPIIPPTWSHAPFEDAKQRIFMSATLGAGGDLERLTGRRNILRLPIPKGWDRQGIGRRFFIFAGMSLDETQVASLGLGLMQEAGRSLVLVPSDAKEKEVVALVQGTLKYPTFSADDIEKTKTSFVGEKQAVAVVANRYDGIDFPGNDCRLEFIEGLPQAVNLQEKFIMSRMGAVAIFNIRIQTRVLQAVGRCTRGLNDYSAVVVSDGELSDYLVDSRRREHFHPELQAEIQFGIEQSRVQNSEEILENFRIFNRNDAEWEDANKGILIMRDAAVQKPYEEVDELQSAVADEVRYQEAMWQSDYSKALEHAREVLGKLNSSKLKGYRAMWHYLAGSAAHLADNGGAAGYGVSAREQFARARDAAKGVPWLVGLSRHVSMPVSATDSRNAAVMRQVERIEGVFVKLGMTHNRRYSKFEQDILAGLSKPETFEAAQKQLGDLLGFTTGKVEEDASPDPWWIADDKVIVFEDHAGATAEVPNIDAKKARQAASHEAWMRQNVPEAKQAEIVSVLVTPARKANKGAGPSLTTVSYWSLEEFTHWAHVAVNAIRNIRTTFTGVGDMDWRVKAAESLEAAGADAPGLFQKLQQSRASVLMEIGD